MFPFSCNDISIHAPREGSDLLCPWPGSGFAREFLSTLPARGATFYHPMLANLGEMISIHAPREGSDRIRSADIEIFKDFYPRSPRGERRLCLLGRVAASARISIHAPREGSDGGL